MHNRDGSFVKYLLSLSMLLPAASPGCVTGPESSASAAVTPAAVEQKELAPTVAAKLTALVEDSQMVAWKNWDLIDFADEKDQGADGRSAAAVLAGIKSEQA